MEKSRSELRALVSEHCIVTACSPSARGKAEFPLSNPCLWGCAPSCFYSSFLLSESRIGNCWNLTPFSAWCVVLRVAEVDSKARTSLWSCSSATGQRYTSAREA